MIKNLKFIAKTKLQSLLLGAHKVPLISKDKPLFIHIPKAAGSSICITLYGAQIGHKMAKYYYFSDKNFLSKYKFSIVREPIARFESAYYFLSKGGISKEDQEFSKKLNEFSDINDFVENCFSKQFIKSCSVPHFFPQTDYIYWGDMLLVDKVFKLEEISNDEKFKEIVGAVKDINRNSSKKENTLTKENQDKIKEIYKLDYQRLGYGY